MRNEEDHEAIRSLSAARRQSVGWRRQTIAWSTCVASFFVLAAPAGAMADPGDWISFADHTCLVDADPATFVDIPCDATCCANSCTPAEVEGAIEPTCQACEKDIAVGDFNNDGYTDLVIARKLPFYAQGGKSNLLFLNQGGTMVDATRLVAGFEDATDDRDIAVIDVNGDDLPDIITAATFGETPRVYINRGCGPPACGGPCPDGGEWCGLQHEPQSIPSFEAPPFFCALGVGDVTGDDCPDLYFVDYLFGARPQSSRLFDRLLVNTKDAKTGDCTGVFEDQTQQRICSGFDPGTPCFTESIFGTGSQIVDMDGDGCNDIVKTESGGVRIIYNDSGCSGNFVAASVSPFVTDDLTYMSMAGDLGADGLTDIYVVTDTEDFFRINQGGREFSENVVVTNSPKVDNFGGNVRFADLDDDGDSDVIVCDADVEIAACDRRMAILRTEVDPETLQVIAIGDPLASGIRPWNTLGTYDAVVFPLTPNGPLALWAGTCDGNRLFVLDGEPLCGASPEVAAPPHDLPKNRFVSFDPANDVRVSFRVEVFDASCSRSGKACSNDSDCVLLAETCVGSPPVMLGWVGDPVEPGTDQTPPGTFTSLVVKNQPSPRVWTEEVVHLRGCEIAPGKTYTISTISNGLLLTEPVMISTIEKPADKFWGDVVGEFNGTEWTAPNGLVNVNDIAALIAFVTLRPAPHITVVDLANEVPNFIINATDLALIIQAFQGRSYPPPPFANQGSPADCQ